MLAQVAQVKASEIVPGDNDRVVFDPVKLQELADSIRQHGLAQPITVRRWHGVYQIVAGERRFRAMSQLLHWDEIPCIIRNMDDEQASGVMLAENASRADLNPIEEANAYQTRIDQFGWSVSHLAEVAGVSPVRVQFRLKLLKLRPELQEMVRTENLPLGYAQILADANLDRNRQMLAVSKLRDNPRPTPGWFRRLVAELFEQQSQEALFDMPLVTGEPLEAEVAVAEEPPLPETTKPPVVKGSPKEVLTAQAQFWSQAAEAWAEIGKPFKRQECEAAARALELAAAAL